MQMPQGIILGQYRPVDSYLHRLDARAKLAFVLLVMVLVLLTRSFAFYGFALVGVGIGLAGSGVGSRRILGALRPIMWLIAITALYHILFSSETGSVVAKLGPLTLTTGGLKAAGYYSLRLLIFVSVAFVVTLTTSPSDMAEAITKILRPLEKVKVPVNDLGLILFLALRFVPILAEEFMAIRNAQALRGVRLTGSRIRRIKQTLHLLIPVFISALGRADDLAMAIEARGFKSGAPRTFYSKARFGKREVLFILISFTILGAAFWWWK